MTMTLQWTTFLNTILVIAPPTTASPSEIVRVLDLGKATGVIMPRL